MAQRACQSGSMHISPFPTTICRCAHSLLVTNKCYFINLFWENWRENFGLILLFHAVSLNNFSREIFLKNQWVNCTKPWYLKLLSKLFIPDYLQYGEESPIFFPFMFKKNKCFSFLHKLAYPFERCVSFCMDLISSFEAGYLRSSC